MPSRRDFIIGVGGVAGSVCLSSPSTAVTAPTRTWSRTYTPSTSPTNEERALISDIVPLTSGFGLVGIAGDSERYRGWIGQVDAAGRTRWHHLDDTGQSVLYAGTKTKGDSDGIVAAGTDNLGTPLSSTGHADPYVVHVGPNGNVPWARTYQPEAPDGKATAIATVANGYILAGNESVASHERLWAAHIDTNGTQNWTWRGELTGSINAAISVPGGVIIAGSTGSRGADSPEVGGREEDAWLAKLSDNGTLVWQWHVDRGLGDRIEDVATGPNGNVVAVGRRGFSTEDRGVGWLVALDTDGRQLWERIYPQQGWSWHHGIASVDSGYILVGTRAESADTDADARGAWLLRVDAGGEPVWEYQAEPGTKGFAVQPLGDGGLLVGGSTSAYAEAAEAAWLAKVGGNSAQGMTSANGPSLPTVPDWTLPVVAGGVIGALGTRAVAYWRRS